MQYLKNEDLPIILDNWQGNPFKGKEFQYIDQSFRPQWSTVFKMLIQPNPQGREKRQDQWRPPVLTDWSYLNSKKEDWIVWLGHATFLLQLGGVRLITDPVFFDLPMIPRKVHLPFPIEALEGIDYLLLSHDHRDHCDARSFKALLKNNRPTILTSLRMETVIGSWLGERAIQEAAWFQVYRTQEAKLRITYLPAKHWCRRGLSDFNRRLWGSFMIEYGDLTIYFGGDSASGAHFKQIGQLFPNIDIAMLGIGAYKPEFMMKDNHTSPSEAFEAFRQLGAQRMIPMHYGTYDLSREPISEPYHAIQECFVQAKQSERLLLTGVNEVQYL